MALAEQRRTVVPQGAGLVTKGRELSEQRQREEGLDPADRLQSKTFWEGCGLYWCQHSGPFSALGDSRGSGGSGEGGGKGEREKGMSSLGEEAPHVPGSPPSETAGCCSPSSCPFHCG